MGQACGAACDKGLLNSEQPIINTANNPDSNPDSEVVKQTCRRNTSKYRMMLNDGEILQTSNSTLSPSISAVINDDNPTNEASDYGETSKFAKLQNAGSLNISSNKLVLSPRSVIIDGDTPKINMQTITKMTTSISAGKINDTVMIPKAQANLYRDQTERSWDVDDLEDLEEEMKMQIKSMSPQQLITPSSAKIQHGSSVDTDNEEYSTNLEVDTRGSNLVQTSSCDWDPNELEMEESHIKKQINHLKSGNDIDSNQ